MDVKIGVSNRHVHLTEEDFFILFNNVKPEKYRKLAQPDQYASNLKVTIKTKKSTIDNVRILIPHRNYTQVELSKTDCYLLGIKPPVRMSGDLTGAEEITIIGPCGEITRKAAIIPKRHIHLNPTERSQLGLTFLEKVSVKLGNDRTAILHDVFLKEDPTSILELHLDTDDANSNFVVTGDLATIIID